MQYEGNGSFKNEVHYPSKFQSGFPVKNSDNLKSLPHNANGRNYVATKNPRNVTQGSWQTGNLKEMRGGGSGANFSSTSNIGFKTPKAAPASSIQNTLASFAYEDKAPSGITKMGGGGPMQKSSIHSNNNNNSFSPSKPVSILKNPNSKSRIAAASNGLFESTKTALKASIQHSFVKPGYTPAHKYQVCIFANNVSKYLFHIYYYYYFPFSIVVDNYSPSLFCSLSLFLILLFPD